MICVLSSEALMEERASIAAAAILCYCDRDRAEHISFGQTPR